MFEQLKSFSRILVTGPQRSGTRLVTQAIAHDMQLQYIDERAFIAIDDAVWRYIVDATQKVVVHCPGMCRYVHEFGQEDDIAIVLVKRPIDEIIASQERINWLWEDFELARYGTEHGPIASVKYQFWHSAQRAEIKHPLEIDYHSLKNHPLWVDKENRQQWQPGQTSPQ